LPFFGIEIALGKLVRSENNDGIGLKNTGI
jgi:hypothetical protein